MVHPLDTLYRRNLHRPHVALLVHIFDRMDRAYEGVARSLDFACAGCEDNCCRSLFYHHTLLEYLLLRTGFEELDASGRQRIRARAATAVAATRERLAASREPKVMCPLNEGGRCVLYACRPMVCRLHGVPHTLVRPDGRHLDGPGCHMVATADGPDTSPRLDRTPFYRELAAAEQACRSTYIDVPRIKMTVSELILNCSDPAEEGRNGDGPEPQEDIS